MGYVRDDIDDELGYPPSEPAPFAPPWVLPAFAAMCGVAVVCLGSFLVLSYPWNPQTVQEPAHVVTAIGRHHSETTARATSAIEKALGPFKQKVEVEVKDTVDRPGQMLEPGRPWTGHLIQLQNGQQRVEIRKASLDTDAELRFYLALARLNEIQKEGDSVALRVGIAHLLRYDDGVDVMSAKMLRRLGPLESVDHITVDDMKHDQRLRERMRGTAWGIAYILHKGRGIPLVDLAQRTNVDGAVWPDVLKTLAEKLGR